MNDRCIGCIAAAMGAGYVSGSEIALFYAQFGSAAHISIIVMTSVYGAFAWLCARLVRTTGADNLPSAIRRRAGRGAGSLTAALHMLALMLAAIRAVNIGGGIGRILLPTPFAYLIGAGICIFGAAAVRLRGGTVCRVWIALCGIGLLILIVFNRPVQRELAHVELLLEDSLPAAAIAGLLHGSLLCAVTGSELIHAVRNELRMRDILLKIVIPLFLLYELAALCVLHAGRNVLSLRMPFVAMASEWGKAGTFASAILILFGASAVLSACIGSTVRIVRSFAENRC